MSNHENHEPPSQYRYAVGAGLGLIIGIAAGLFTDQVVASGLIGIAVGIVIASLRQVRQAVGPACYGRVRIGSIVNVRVVANGHPTVTCGKCHGDGPVAV